MTEDTEMRAGKLPAEGSFQPPGFDPWGWQCEDCPFFTFSEDEAGAHSDARKHSLARCPENKRKPKNDSKAKRQQRKRQKVRQKERISELESQNKRLLKLAASALERCEVATDPSGAADEAAALLRQVVTLDGSYVPWDAARNDEPMFEPPELDPAMREGKPGSPS